MLINKLLIVIIDYLPYNFCMFLMYVLDIFNV